MEKGPASHLIDGVEGKNNIYSVAKRSFARSPPRVTSGEASDVHNTPGKGAYETEKDYREGNKRIKEDAKK